MERAVETGLAVGPGGPVAQAPGQSGRTRPGTGGVGGQSYRFKNGKNSYTQEYYAYTTESRSFWQVQRFWQSVRFL